MSVYNWNRTVGPLCQCDHIFIYNSPFFPCLLQYSMILFHFPPQILWAAHSETSANSTVFVQSFLKKRFLWVHLQIPWSVLLPFVPVDALSKTLSVCGNKIRASAIKLKKKKKKSPSFRQQLYCMWLSVRLVYLCVFDHDSIRLCLIPVVLWQFVMLVKGPSVSEVRSEETGPEKPVSSWEKIRKDTNFRGNHCEVHSGFWLP